MPEIKGLDALKDKCHRYLWQCGYYLTSGMKYGCDWLAYEHPPDLVHAKYIVSVLDVDKKVFKKLHVHEFKKPCLLVAEPR